MRKFFFFSALLSAILFLGTDHLFFPKESRADSHQAPAPSAPVAESPAALTYVFECSDGTIFPARMEGNDAWLFLPGRTVKLPPVPSASGAKYSDHSIVFWTKGEEAFLQTEDKRKKRNAKTIAAKPYGKMQNSEGSISGPAAMNPDGTWR